MVKPIFPVFEYALNYHHFKNVLCENRELPDLKCNGTCVLAKRIEAAKSLSLPPFAPPNFEFDIKEYPLSTLESEDLNDREAAEMIFFIPRMIGNTTDYIRAVLHPPTK